MKSPTLRASDTQSYQAESRPPTACPVCAATLAQSSRTAWLSECAECGFLSSSLWDSAVWERKVSELDEANRIPGIKQLRQTNARKALSLLSALMPLQGKQLLDIGCGYGWFLETAQEFALEATGIEPEQRIAQVALDEGLSVKVGCFPEVLAAHEQFDIITFNDVLEHIPGPDAVVDACAHHLRQDGLLAITIPSRSGAFYRIASALHSVGFSGPFERLWQKNFHSPHVSYFDPQTLNRIVTARGFTVVHQSTLPSFQLRGLYQRLCMDQAQSRVTAPLLWLGLVAGAAVLRVMPQDIIFHVYKKSA